MENPFYFCSENVFMAQQRQIFQTSSRLRWNTFKWVARLILFLLVVMIPIVWVAMDYDATPLLPGLSRTNITKIDPVQIKGFSKKEKNDSNQDQGRFLC